MAKKTRRRKCNSRNCFIEADAKKALILSFFGIKMTGYPQITAMAAYYPFRDRLKYRKW